MKIEKNYFRRELLSLEEDSKLNPIVFTGKYKHTDNPKWATFTTIRKYENGEKTKTVCNHINIERDIVIHYVRLTEIEHNRKFYICGRISTYEHFGDTRGRIILAENCCGMPIWMTAGTKEANIDSIKAFYGSLAR